MYNILKKEVYIMSNNRRTLRRSTTDRKVAGVCGGLAKWLDVDSTAIRVAFIVLSFIPVTFPTVIIYFLCWLIMDDDTVA